MRLLQLKIRGLGDLPETDWLQAGRRCTVIGCARRQSSDLLIKAIESLNPIIPCRESEPFKKIPHHTTTPDGYKKVIDPTKRTIVFGIYDSPSSLVHELGDITPALYETDRIEIGRRLDLSRWINFVELASSSRWSEVSDEISRLFSMAAQTSTGGNEIASLIGSFADTDRIKGKSGDRLAAWLGDLKKYLPGQGISATLEKVERWQRFNAARRLVEKRLPLMIPMTLAHFEAGLKHQTAEVSGNGPMAPIILANFFEESSAAGIDKELTAISSRFAENQIIALVNASYSARDLPAESQFYGAEAVSKEN